MRPTRRWRRLGVEALEGRRLLTAVCEPLTLNAAPSSATLDQPQQVRSYCFAVPADQAGRVTLSMSASAGSLDSYLALYALDDAGGARPIVQHDDLAPGDRAAQIRLHLTSGTYRVDASAAPGSTGAAATGAFQLAARFEPAKSPFADIVISGGAVGLALGDFNGDGELDLATANESTDDVSILFGLGDGTFRERESRIEVGDGPLHMIRGDFNGDGHHDLAVANGVGRNTWLLTGDGHGGFTKAGVLDTRGEADVMYAGKIDNDKYDDLVVPFVDNDVFGAFVFFGHELVRPQEALDLSDDQVFNIVDHTIKLPPLECRRTDRIDSPRSAAVDDVDGDKRRDILLPFKACREVAVWFGEGANGRAFRFGADYRSLPGEHPGEPTHNVESRFLLSQAEGDGLEDIVIHDFDRDTILDVATVSDRAEVVVVRLGKGDGTFRDNGPRYPVGQDSEGLIKVDLNNDARMDLVTRNEDTLDLSILLGNGDGTFVVQPPLPLRGQLPDNHLAADFNHDGLMDIAVAARGQGVQIWFGLGNGSFTQEEAPTTGYRPEAVAAGDFNYDGFQDVAVANGLGQDVSVLLGRGDGSFLPREQFPLRAPTKDKCGEVVDQPDDRVPHADGLTPQAIVAHDVNDDGRLDLVTANEATDNATILLGLGDGRFEVEQNVQVGDSPWSLVAADLDGDGFVDLATANRVDNTVTIRYGNENRCYVRQDYDLGVGLFPELVEVAPTPADRTFALRTFALRTFALRTLNRLSHDVSVVTIGGMDRKLQNVVRSQATPADAARLPGLDRDNRAPPTDTTRKYRPRVLVSADFNGDEILDLVAPDDDAGELSVFLGHGDGTFQPALRFPTRVGDPEFVAAGDLNGDGDLDLVTAHDGEDSIAVFLGGGDGSFRFFKEFDVEDGPEGILIADWNGDDRPDLAVANNNSENLTILLNVGEDKGLLSGNTLDGHGESDFTAGHFGRRLPFSQGQVRPLDIVTFDDEQNAFLLRRGDGKGGFSEETPLPVCEDCDPRFEFMTNGDLNADGFLDVVAADLNSDTVWVLWGQDGTANDGQAFQTPVPYRISAKNVSSGRDFTIRPVGIGDFNDDGHPDLITIQETEQSIVVLCGDGKDGFGLLDDEGLVNPCHVRKLGLHPVSLTVGNFNGDAFVDVAIGDRDSNDIRILLGDRNEVLRPGAKFSIGPERNLSTPVDLNGDRADELVSLNRELEQLKIEDKSSAGAGGDAVQFPRGVAPLVADLNGDDRVDAVTVAATGELLVRIADKELDGQFLAPGRGENVAAVRDATLVLTVAGVRVATADRTGDTVTIYKISSVTNDLERVQRIDVADGPARIAAADVNGDEREDLVVASLLAGVAEVLLQQPGGIFVAAPSSTVTIGRVSDDLVLADVAGDQFVDLVIADAGAGVLRVWTGRGDGSFAPAPLTVLAGDDLFIQAADQRLRSRLGTNHVAVGNFDGDERIDLVTANSGTNSLSFLSGKSGGVPSTSESIPLADAPGQIVVGRFNNDELDDIAVLLPLKQQISVLVQQSGGGWRPIQDGTFSSGSEPLGITTSELNGDGNADLVVSSQYGDLLVLLGIGDGTFRRGSRQVQVTVGDITGDGIDDSIIANQSSDRICVNNEFDCYGDGQALAPGTPAVADVNVDGLPDLIIPNSGSNNTLVFLGKPGGKLEETPRSFHAGGQPTFISIQEITGDGIPDLIVANEGSNDITILKGVGQGEEWTLENGPRIDVGVGAGPIHVQAADVSSRGTGQASAVDLIVTNQRTNELMIIPGRGGGFFATAASARTIVSTGKGPRESLLVGRSIVTINRDSNSFTQYNPDTGATTTFPTGGVRPLRGFVTSDVLLNVVHENGNASFFLARASGFRLIGLATSRRSFTGTGFVVRQTGRGFETFGVGNGRTELVSLSQFSPAVLIVDVASVVVTALSSFLPLAGTSVTSTVGGDSPFPQKFAIPNAVGLLLELSVAGNLGGSRGDRWETLPPHNLGGKRTIDDVRQRILDEVLANPHWMEPADGESPAQREDSLGANAKDAAEGDAAPNPNQTPLEPVGVEGVQELPLPPDTNDTPSHTAAPVASAPIAYVKRTKGRDVETAAKPIDRPRPHFRNPLLLATFLLPLAGMTRLHSARRANHRSPMRDCPV